MGICGSTATVPSEPASAPAPQVTETVTPLPVPAPQVDEKTTPPPGPAPQQTETTTPPPVPSQPSTENSPVPPSRTRTRTLSRPEWLPRSRTKSAPQSPQSLKSPSTQKPRARAETLIAPEAKKATPPPVPSQPSAEKAPDPSSPPTSRTRTRSLSRPSEWLRRGGVSSQDSNPRSRTKSEPQPPQSLQSPSPKKPRARAETLTAPKRSNRRDSRPPMPAENLKLWIRYPSRRTLKSTVKQLLADHPQLRILVVGKKGTGKSALINTAFGVNMSAAPARASNINFGFCPDDNRRIIIHECSGLEPGDAQGVRPILDFISNRTDPSRSASERLHAIWICVTASDALNGSIGEGVEEILRMRKVPVIVAFTKSDTSFPQISGSESGSSQYWGRTRSMAYTQCEQLCRPLFRMEPRDIPAELVSVKPQFGGLINNLIMTTDQFIMGSLSVSSPSASSPSAWSSSQGIQQRIAPCPLAWSVALRASRDISIQASIEVGRSRYWRNLWSSLDFIDQFLKSCVNIIHVDIVQIWNLYDKNRYLSNNQFKIYMSHIVKDLAVPAGGASPNLYLNRTEDKFANWVDDVYQGSQENVQCMMSYIVTLTVLLDGIFKAAPDNVTEDAVLKVMDTHVRSRRESIHRDIRSFVTETSEIRSAVPQKDLVFEKIVDLIKRYCAPP